jgi:hypothetical protein
VVQGSNCKGTKTARPRKEFSTRKSIFPLPAHTYKDEVSKAGLIKRTFGTIKDGSISGLRYGAPSISFINLPQNTAPWQKVLQ